MGHTCTSQLYITKEVCIVYILMITSLTWTKSLWIIDCHGVSKVFVSDTLSFFMEWMTVCLAISALHVVCCDFPALVENRLFNIVRCKLPDSRHRYILNGMLSIFYSLGGCSQYTISNHLHCSCRYVLLSASFPHSKASTIAYIFWNSPKSVGIIVQFCINTCSDKWRKALCCFAWSSVGLLSVYSR